MNRYEVVFKIRLSKKLRDSIIEDAQKREKKTSVYVREQLDRTFRFSQTDIKKIEKKINVISDAGKKINMIARKHNTDGITEVDDETFIHLDEIRKSLEDILVIMSQEKNLDYHTHRDEDEAKDSTFAVRMSLERYREIKRLSREQEISMTQIGKYGMMAAEYLKENERNRYNTLYRLGRLAEKMKEVDTEANSLMDTLMTDYLKKHKPQNPTSTMEMWKLRNQAKMMAEEVVLNQIVYRFH